MSELEALLAQVRAAAVERGPQWLQQQLADVLGGSGSSTSPVPSSPGRKRARKVRPPERLSPSPVPKAHRARRSPCPRDPPGLTAGLPAHASGVGPGRNPTPRRSSTARSSGRSMRQPSPSPPPCRCPVWEGCSAGETQRDAQWGASLPLSCPEREGCPGFRETHWGGAVIVPRQPPTQGSGAFGSPCHCCAERSSAG